MTKGIVGGKWRYTIAGDVIWFTEAHNRDWCYIGTRAPEYCRLLAEAHWAGLPENQVVPTAHRDRREALAAIGVSPCSLTVDAETWLPETTKDDTPVDAINPSHYRNHPSGVECIDITEHFGFNLGNAIKYIWRAGLKTTSPVEDLTKARWYLDRQIAMAERKEAGQ